MNLKLSWPLAGYKEKRIFENRDVNVKRLEFHLFNETNEKCEKKRTGVRLIH
jgi:hypothetical protein